MVERRTAQPFSWDNFLGEDHRREIVVAYNQVLNALTRKLPQTFAESKTTQDIIEHLPHLTAAELNSAFSPRDMRTYISSQRVLFLIGKLLGDTSLDEEYYFPLARDIRKKNIAGDAIIGELVAKSLEQEPSFQEKQKLHGKKAACDDFVNALLFIQNTFAKVTGKEEISWPIPLSEAAALARISPYQLQALCEKGFFKPYFSEFDVARLVLACVYEENSLPANNVDDLKKALEKYPQLVYDRARQQVKY